MDDPPPDSASLPEAHPATPAGCRFNPWVFFGVLAAPAILSIITLYLDGSNYGESALLVLLIGSIIAGLVCGIHFTLAQKQPVGVKVFLGIISVVGCAGAAFAIGFGTCFLIQGILGGFY